MAHRPRGPVVLTGYTSKPESLSYFLSELHNIRESQIISDDVEITASEDVPGDSPEDHNADWLRKAGFDHFVFLLEDSKGEDETVLNCSELETKTSVLPHAHAAAIKQRMSTLRTTIRSRHGGGKKGSHSDVRQLFSKENHVDSQHYEANGPVQLLSIEQRHSVSSLGCDPSSRGSTPPVQSTDASRDLSPSKYMSFSRRKSADVPDTDSSSMTTPNGTSHSSRNHISSSKSIGDIKLSCRIPSFTTLTEDDLPNISLDPDPLGITKIGDLSPDDMEKIQCLAHIELTITFDENNISFKHLRPHKHKILNDDQLFGIPLSTLMDNDSKIRDSKADIPLVFKMMVDHLERTAIHDEGILRVPGSKQRVQSLLEEIRVKFSENKKSFSFEGRKSTDIASLLKQFLRDLPIPLLTREHLPSFASIADISDLKEQVRTLNLLVLMLPELHQKVLKYLLLFCERIHRERQSNKMDMTNIAMVLAPNLFCVLPSSKLGCDDVTLASKTSHVILLLIRYHHVLWTIPGGMLHQVRFLYESELKKLSQRLVRKAIEKMNTSESPTKNKEAAGHIIRVEAPLYTCVRKAVNIQQYPTAGTVVAKMRKRSHINKDVVRNLGSTNLPDSGSHSDDSLDDGEEISVGEQFLYEVGGNIGERRLDNDTNILALCEVNPNAQWIVKPRNFHVNINKALVPPSPH